MAAAYDVVAALTPPDGFVDDHALIVAYYEEAVAIDRTIGEAARSGDATTFLVANYELGTAAAPAIFDVAPAICSATFAQAGPVCSAAIDIPESDYERALRLAVRDFAVLFTPSGPWSSFDLLPAGSDEPVVAAAAILAPQAIAAIDETSQSVSALDPPTELASDHARLLAYLDELRVLQEGIAAAAEAADATLVRGGIDATALAFCRAAADLSPASHPAVGFFFGKSARDRTLLCG